MNKPYHILNGDALREQFPNSISGEIIVARECLVDGNVKGETLEELLETRAEFISQNYEECTIEKYKEKTGKEFEKIRSIPFGTDVNLWFEDDLFCQVNFWFVMHLLSESKNRLFIVRPKKHTQFGFGGLNESMLEKIYAERIEINEKSTLSKLWPYYQNGDVEGLLKTGSELAVKYPFIFTAVKAHIERIPIGNHLGRPKETLMKIIKELQTEDFGTVFKAFSARESIYGFGDVQVHRLWKELLKEEDKK